MPRGGRREGAGRPKGTTKGQKVIYYRRVRPWWVAVLDDILQALKESEKNNENGNNEILKR